MYSLIFYSHSDYSDAWAPMFGQTDKYFDHNFKKYLFVNSGDHDVPSGWEVLEYDDNLPYQRRVASCLAQLPPAEIVVFHHEDMFLHGEPNFKVLERTCERITSGKADFIKLCKATYAPHIPLFRVEDELYSCPYDLLFAIQPTMCKVENLQTIYEQTPGDNIWEFEANTNAVCMKNSFICCLTHLEGEQRIGMFHWESFVYPYFATAIIKGEWNTEGYPHKLIETLEGYSVDYKKRGVNS